MMMVWSWNIPNSNFYSLKTIKKVKNEDTEDYEAIVSNFGFNRIGVVFGSDVDDGLVTE